MCALHQAKRFDLVLLDLQMPGMDGFQVMAALKAMDPGQRQPSPWWPSRPSRLTGRALYSRSRGLPHQAIRGDRDSWTGFAI